MRPPFLKQGDEVAVVSPAGKTDAELIAAGITTLQSWNLKITVMPHAYGSFHQYSGSDWNRINDLQEAINNPCFKAIIFTRGGYGCSRIVDRVDFSPLLDYPKWLVGFSDVTVLHAQLHRMRIESIHGSMLKNFHHGAETVKAALFGTLTEHQIVGHPLNRAGNAIGVIVGGNLTLINNLIGTPSDIVTYGKILFIEDLNEQLYHLDRLMTQLKRTKKLENLTGLIIGQFYDMKDSETTPFGKTVEEIIFDAVKEYHYPVCFNFPAGHVDNNRAFYLGRKSKLTVNATSATLSFLI
jgi:muramoyltetrapeptide carboxypeptidase